MTSKAVQRHQLQKQHKGATIPAQIPDGMMLVSIAEYELMRRAYLELQQVVNPLFGLDRLQTGKQRRRDAHKSTDRA